MDYFVFHHNPNVDLIPVSRASFSSLMGFTLIDWTWAVDTSASYISLAYRHLVETIVKQGRFQEEKGATFPLSPTLCSELKKNQRNLNSSYVGAILKEEIHNIWQSLG